MNQKLSVGHAKFGLPIGCSCGEQQAVVLCIWVSRKRSELKIQPWMSSAWRWCLQPQAAQGHLEQQGSDLHGGVKVKRYCIEKTFVNCKMLYTWKGLSAQIW